jgi:DNA-binding CsgD family transcriptional regulator
VRPFRTVAALLAVETGDREHARQEFAALAAAWFTDVPRDQSWLPDLALAAEVCAALADAERAEVLYELLRPYAGQAVVAGLAIVCLGALQRSLGLLAATVAAARGARAPAAARRWWQDAEAHYQAAMAMNARMGARPALARARFGLGAMLLAQRDADYGHGDAAEQQALTARARSLLEAAHADAAEMGMALLVRHCADALAGLSGGRPATPAPPGYPDGLTRREAEVLALIAAGLSNREIADRLVLSVRTVERHIANIYTKTDLHERRAVRAFAAQHGLV